MTGGCLHCRSLARSILLTALLLSLSLLTHAAWPLLSERGAVPVRGGAAILPHSR